jgi:GNAT superfamily N-acetyltransferase
MITDGVVRLRPYAGAADVERAVAWYQDPEVLYFSEGPDAEPFDRARVERMYQYLARVGELYVIEVATDAGWLPVGDVTLSPETLPIVVGEAAWRGRGIGSRVLALLIARARTLGWPALAAKHIWPDNTRSRRLFQRHGFRLVHVGVDEAGRRYERYRLDLRDPVVIRLAAPDDANALADVHRAAVRGLAGPYTATEIDAWIAGIESAGYVQAMQAGEVFFLAARDDTVLGFAARRAAEITALYVHPAATRQGVGGALLTAVEASAWADGHRTLRLDASLPAVPFYRRRGYREVSPVSHTLRDGTPLAAVRMDKTFTAFPG